MTRQRMIAVMAVALAPLGARAQEPAPGAPSAVAALERCLGITADAARLACLDTAARALVEASRNREVVVLDRATVDSTRRSLFGLGPAAGTPLDRAAAAGPPPERIDAEVVRAVAGRHGFWTVTLADGAQWTTTEALSAAVPPRPGTTVTIRRVALGGYMLNYPGGRPTRARRTG